MKDKYSNIFLASTDTVVGIGCFYNDPESLKLIYEIKNRPIEKKIVIMIPSVEVARTFEGWNDNAEKLSLQWPGPLTIVLNDEVALRIPNCKQLIKLMEENGPIYMTSANLSGQPTLPIDEAIKQFSQIKTHYTDCIGSNKASIIIDARDNKMLRG